jgi:hypothetical protein
MHVLKFKYAQKELSKYLDILKEMPIFTELKYHNKLGDEMRRITYYENFYEETRY